MLGPAAAVLTMAAAGSGPSTGDVVTYLLAQGPIGIIAAGLLVALRRESKRADTERSRADAAVAGKDLMVTAFLEKIVPALTEAASATRELADARRRHD